MSLPLISLFTPTHDPSHLYEAWTSLRWQHYDNWEWVIVPNGTTRDVIADTARRVRNVLPCDDRIRIVPVDTISSNVGALKRFACSACKGDAFLELDHDDMLSPCTLPRVAQQLNNGAGFVYSDDTILMPDGSSRGYSANWGWQNYDVIIFGKPFTATKTFDINPRSLCEVYYAPDHLRCWSREAYYRTGGHDASMAVGDDHDLICRTYIKGFSFAHTGNCGYIYRDHSGNTVKARANKIKTQQQANRKKYLDGLIAEWCRREGYAKINLLDLFTSRKWSPDLPIADVLPTDKPIGHIVASDILQMVPAHMQVTFFNDAHAALVPEGFLSLVVPHEAGTYATMRPTNRVRFNEKSFLWYTDPEFKNNQPGVECDYDQVQCFQFYPSGRFKEHDMKMLRADLCVLKGQRHPGPKKS